MCDTFKRVNENVRQVQQKWRLACVSSHFALFSFYYILFCIYLCNCVCETRFAKRQQHKGDYFFFLPDLNSKGEEKSTSEYSPEKYNRFVFWSDGCLPRDDPLRGHSFVFLFIPNHNILYFEVNAGAVNPTIGNKRKEGELLGRSLAVRNTCPALFFLGFHRLTEHNFPIGVYSCSSQRAPVSL